MTTSSLLLNLILTLAPSIQADVYPDRKMTKEERKVREEMIQEITEKATECGVAKEKRKVNDAFAKALGITEDVDPLVQKFIVVFNGLDQLKSQLKTSGVTLEFGVERELEEACKLSDQSKMFNFGSVEALMYVKRMSDLVTSMKDRTYKMNVLRIEIAHLLSTELYEKNRKPDVTDEVRYEKQADGSELRRDIKIAKIYVNAGDFETGLMLFPLIEALVSSDK